MHNKSHAVFLKRLAKLETLARLTKKIGITLIIKIRSGREAVTTGPKNIKNMRLL